MADKKSAKTTDVKTEQTEALEPVKPKKPKMKPRGGNSPVVGDNGVLLAEGDASKAAETMIDILLYDDMFGDLFRNIKTEQDIIDLRSTPLDLDNINSLKRRFVGYVASCVQKDIRFGNLMAYQAIGINKGLAYDWEHGRTRGAEWNDFIKKVKDVCASYREYLGMSGQLNPVTLVWWQKNYDGLVDVQTVVNYKGEEIPTPEVLRDRIASTIIDK